MALQPMNYEQQKPPDMAASVDDYTIHMFKKVRRLSPARRQALIGALIPLLFDDQVDELLNERTFTLWHTFQQLHKEIVFGVRFG